VAGVSEPPEELYARAQAAAGLDAVVGALAGA